MSDKTKNNDIVVKEFDLVIIGGGSGGLAMARESSKLGINICIFDYVEPSPYGTKWGLGGTCVNVGCIPKKLMHKASLLGEEYNYMEKYGWKTKDEITNNWNVLKNNINDYISSLNWSYRSGLKKMGVTYINKKVQFNSDKNIIYTTKNGVKIRVIGKYYVIATGGRPNIPDIPGKELGITSDDIFKLDNAPGDTLVIGGSYVALECAGFLSGLGHKTDIMIRTIPLRGFDQDMANKIVNSMKKQKNLNFIYQNIPVRLEKKNDKIVVYYKNNNTGEVNSSIYQTVLFAIGRKINTKELKLDNLDFIENGKVKVDENYQTNIDNIFCIGDAVENSLELTPIAIKEAELLTKFLFIEKKLISIDSIEKYVATTVFTPLEYSFVGLSYEKSMELYSNKEIEIYHSYFTPLENEITETNKNNCYCKIIVHKESDKILGIHLLSPNSGEIIQGFSILVYLGITKKKLDSIVGIHPTIAEIIFNLKTTLSSGLDAKKNGC